MVGIVNRPHTRRMMLLRTTTSRALFRFAFNHGPLLRLAASLFDSEWLPERVTSTAAASPNPLTVSTVVFLNKSSTDAVCFVAIVHQQRIYENRAVPKALISSPAPPTPKREAGARD